LEVCERFELSTGHSAYRMPFTISWTVANPVRTLKNICDRNR